MAGNGWNCWKLLEIAENGWNGWKLLEIAEMAAMAGNSLKWRERAGKGCR